MDTRIDMHFTVLLTLLFFGPCLLLKFGIWNRESGNCFLHVLMDGSLPSQAED